jgi:hypothetical protein
MTTMDLSQIKFITPKQVESLTNTSTIVEVKETIVLCQNCNTNERSNTQSLLCHDCIAENKEILEDKKNGNKSGALPAPDLTPTITQTTEPLFNPEELPLETNSKHSAKSIRFAPPSIRYDGKQLDEIAWSMLPALPESVILDINKLVLSDARAFASQDVEPTVQDIDVLAEYCIRLGNMMKSLGAKKKDKLILSAKPELKRQEKERREKEKSEKIQQSIPKDVVSKHTANILLKDIAEITAPMDKATQSIVKQFLDHVSLQSQIEDEITGAWLTAQLSKPKYQPIKQYFKIKG